MNRAAGTADLACGYQRRVDVELIAIGEGRELERDHAHLNFPADVELLLHAVLLTLYDPIGVLQGVLALLQGHVGFHPGLEDRRIYRLQDIVFGSQLEPLGLVHGLILGGQENYRDLAGLGIGFEPFAHLVTVHLRHHDVQKNQIR
jgi:hypothetical protein